MIVGNTGYYRPERLAMFQEFSKARYKTENGVRTPVFDSVEYEKLSDREKQLFAAAETGKIDGVIVDEAKEREASLKAAMIEDQVEGFYQEFQQKNGRLPTQKEASSKLLELTSPYSATAIFDAEIFPQYKTPQASGSPSIRGFTDAPELADALPDGLAPYASDFLEAAQKYNLDPYALAAIAAHETGNGTSKAFRNKNNAMGVSNSSGPRSFENVRDSIFAQAKTLSGPIYKGADTFDAVGRIYAPVGAENDPTSLNGYWPGGVSSHYAKLKQNASR
ncbi:MAG: glucosaminidase domain-containing protein [Verrucomicrobiaceae bacterium]|nr:glucosaminidase domain-containing protein [Verrucomicrobiaceae bacterium]